MSDPRIPPGSRFANYKIISRLKAGGMGTLYRATPIEGGETMVLKVLHEHLAHDNDFVRMFDNEAVLASQIHHPKVVGVVDRGTVDGLPYLVMEYVDGCSLHDLAKLVYEQGQRFPVDLAVWIAAEVADALQAAHEARDKQRRVLGIVHRDVSPENILLSWKGDVKLTDFGIAQARTTHTTGAFKGKVRYMAPEQARGDTVDRRADIYSLGMVLWEVLTGRPRFSAATDFALLRQVVDPAPVPVSLYTPTVSAELDAAVACALEVDCDLRFQCADDFRTALNLAEPSGSGVALSAFLVRHIAKIKEIVQRASTPVVTRTRRMRRTGQSPPPLTRSTTPPFPFQSVRPEAPGHITDSATTEGEPRIRAATMPGLSSLVTAVVRESHNTNPALVANQALLTRRLAMMARVGPKLTPALFTAPDERVAYLLNAFITLAALALTRTPFAGEDEPPPTSHYEEVTIDGRKTTLNDLDRRLGRVRDPRMYAAILEVLHAEGWFEAFTGADLERRLDNAMKRLINSPAFLVLDHALSRLTVRASVRPFTRWFGARARAVGVGDDWFGLLSHYARQPLQGELMMARDAAYTVVFSSDMLPLEGMDPLSTRML